MIFSELIINDKNWQHLSNAHDNNRLPHALLFHGEEGMGKEAHALELAALLNCENIKNGNSCGNCSSCNKIRTFKHENIKLIMPFPRGGISSSKDSPLKAFKNEKAFQDYLTLLNKKSDDPYFQMRIPGANTILINSIRDLKHDVVKSTVNDSWKIILIFQAEKLCVPSPAAGHALLKVLEEPPDKTMFILVSSNMNLIIDTIRSRCQSMYFSPISDQIIKQKLISMGQDSAQATIISKISNGNISLSKELADNYQELMKKMYVLLNSFFTREFLIWEKSIDIIIRLKRKDIYLLDQLFNVLILFFRDLHYYVRTSDQDEIIHSNLIEKIMNLCKKYSQANWSACIDHIENARDYILRNGNISLMAINMIIDIQQSINGKNEEKFKLSDWISI